MHRIVILAVIFGLLGGSAFNGICSAGPLDDWTPRHSQGSGYFGDVAFGGGLFIAIGHDPVGTIYRSPDGATWSAMTSNSSALLSGLTCGEGRFLGTGSGGEILTSADGIT
jgi:hypothetical protein